MGEAKRKRRAQLQSLLPPGGIMVRTAPRVNWPRWEFAAAGVPICVTRPALLHEEWGCPACDIIEGLLEAGLLPRFRAAWRSVGNCHVATEAFRQDLEPLGDENPFAFMCGCCVLLVTDRDPDGYHCWLEHDGWAIEVANGAAGNPITIMPVDDFYAAFELTRICRQTG